MLKSNYKLELCEVSFAPKQHLEARESLKGSWSLLT